ncbi:MAG TPA: PLP-dependent aminotransferase family protein [Kofleriaceae bacterium]|nr:PLP-dependent aminotransferase family protein [Kofleriaceae bacterium]
MSAGFRIRLDRDAASSLTEQISRTIRAAILDGRLAAGARLPSWRDLAAQLGVARGTVRAAYERLTDELLVTASGPGGTHVTERPPRATVAAPAVQDRMPRYPIPAMPFQMGVPAYDAFPAKLWARVFARAARAEAAAPGYPDPRGALELRAQIAGHLALARGIRCVPEQIIVTRGYRDGLNLAIRTLRLEGGVAWMEEPGYFLTRSGLTLAGMRPAPIPVDEQGLDVQQGIAVAPDAALAVVTAGQQAPLGVTLSSSRRQALVRWATRAGGWVIEDDYLSELQLTGRAAPALAAMDRTGRVIYAGTFSKTMTPSIGLGFVVAPAALAAQFTEVAACLAPAPSPVMQLAVAEFLRDGHYLRHLRRMKRLYAARRDALRRCLGSMSGAAEMAGLALLLRLPRGTDDVAIERKALARGLAPAALSSWYATDADRAPGLLLCITNLADAGLQRACDRLRALVEPRA